MVSVLWAGGRLRDPREPVLSGADAGFATGLGVFETCAVAAGRAFALTRHLDRLAASLRALDLPPVDEGEVRDAVAAVLAAGGADVGRVRVTVSPGAPGAAAPSLVVTAGPAPLRGPAHVVRVPWVRNERSPLAGHKSTSYAADVLALAAAQRAGGNEAVLANTRGELCEGTGSNVFVERDGALLTPPLSSGCLPGVTRALALEWAAEAGLPVAEARSGELPWEVLDDVRRGGASLALSGSLRGFVGVHALDGAAVATGPLTAAVAELFRARAGADPDP
ncbi:4-amino-4-deoxychorismate lyase [Cellulomonas hominis]|uniref:4-amino-4-deoxychorismate lyase n=1 Tax=Cellulomonas hominis TaxID=156981 RepID=A0A511F6T1_9CELL|nr:aminotransferase class IV [Cellulomonas hominis]MBB5474956.1 branched-chain amino acid aminotransferase [Cellulomonas hominis]GEL44980.1 4-amino-4-deoxychorismate lyase [Cellulomonas hominis]